MGSLRKVDKCSRYEKRKRVMESVRLTSMWFHACKSSLHPRNNVQRLTRTLAYNLSTSLSNASILKQPDMTSSRSPFLVTPCRNSFIPLCSFLSLSLCSASPLGFYPRIPSRSCSQGRQGDCFS
jgi:hypothetical protein